MTLEVRNKAITKLTVFDAELEPEALVQAAKNVLIPISSSSFLFQALDMKGWVDVPNDVQDQTIDQVFKLAKISALLLILEQQEGITQGQLLQYLRMEVFYSQT